MAIFSLTLYLFAHSFVLAIEPARVAGMAINDTFRISVNVADVEHFYGYNVSITFDSLVLEVIQVTQGPFMSRFGNTFWIPPNILPGKVENAAEAMLGTWPAPIGSGTLFTVKFKVIGTGSSELHLYSPDIAFSDPNANPLPYFVLLDGWYGSQAMCDYGQFQISNAANHQELPTSSWIENISKYAVVWQDNRNGNYDIYGQLVNSDGTLSGSAYAVIDSSGNQLEPAIAYNPIGFWEFALVVWTDYRRGLDSADIYGRFLVDGTPISDAEFAVAHYPGFQMNPGIARCGSRYLVIWEDTRDDGGIRDTTHIYGQLLTNMGAAIGPPILISPSSADYEWNYNFTPSIASGDSAFIVTWMDYKRYGYIEHYLQFRIVDTLGNLGTIENITTNVSNAFYQPSCAFDGSNFLVIWTAWRDSIIKGQFISQQGTPIGSNFTIYTTPDRIVQAAKVNFDGSHYLVVWDEKSGDDDYIKGRRVAPDGSLIDTAFILCTVPYQQTFPSGAKGTSSIVAWQDYRNGADYDIWGYLGPPIGIKGDAGLLKPGTIRLDVHPNPFSKLVNISFDKELSVENTELKIYDATGRLVRNLPIHRFSDSPIQQIFWDGTDDINKPVDAGVYFVKLGSQAKKIIFLR